MFTALCFPLKFQWQLSLATGVFLNNSLKAFSDRNTENTEKRGLNRTTPVVFNKVVLIFNSFLLCDFTISKTYRFLYIQDTFMLLFVCFLLLFFLCVYYYFLVLVTIVSATILYTC